MYNYKRKYGEIDKNSNDDNNHVWNGRNERIRDKPPPPQKVSLNNMSYLDIIDDKSGATLFVTDPNGNGSISYECKHGKINFRKTRRDSNSIQILCDPNASVFQDSKWKQNLLQSFYNWQSNRKNK